MQAAPDRSPVRSPWATRGGPPVRRRPGGSVDRASGPELAGEPEPAPVRSAEGGRAAPSTPEDLVPVTGTARDLRASFAFVERNFNLTRRYWGWEVAFLVYAVAGALSITPHRQGEGFEARLILSLMVGAIFWNYLSTALRLHRRDDHSWNAGRAPSSTR